MHSRRLRRRRSWAQFAAVGSLLVGAPSAAFAIPEVVALRGVPSSLSAEYGPAVSLGGSVIAAPSGSGVELYDLAQPGPALLGRFRAPGTIAHASAAGTTLFLFAGTRGVIAVDASDASDPVAVGSAGNLGAADHGAAAPAGGGVLAASGSTLQFLSWDPASGFELRRTLTYADGRVVNAIAARGDSFLVASTRPGGGLRLILTTYRMRAGASAPDSLGEAAFNGHRAEDVAWSGGTAFVADGNLGVLVVDLIARTIRGQVPVGTKFVRSVDANDLSVVAGAEARTLARFVRAGAAGDSLVPGAQRLLTGDPAAVRLIGDWAVASTYDQIAPSPPEESGLSLLEFVSLSGAPEPLPAGGTGRVRRVAVRDGLAYVADYTGGLRIYRAGGADSSLVGVMPPASAITRPVDVLVDPVLPLVYLASGPAGLEVVRVSDPAAPASAATMTFPGSATAVALVQPNLLAVARRGLNAGVSFVELAYDTLDQSVLLVPRGSVEAPFLQDPRALASRDTVLFVADELIGLRSIGFGNPDLPSLPGASTTAAARDLDLTGTTLLVATRTRGLQVVDVTNPTAPVLLTELPTPPLLGVARNGSSAALFLGEEGALIVDVTTLLSPTIASVRGPVAVPGRARDGWWSGDTLLVAASLGLERFTVSPTPSTGAALEARLDPGSALPRAVVTWPPVAVPGAVGLVLYRDVGVANGLEPTGTRVNRDLLPPGAVSAVDDSLPAGDLGPVRYRLEAFFADGSSIQVAEGILFVPSAPLVGRAYPNPFRPGNGARASLPYRSPGSGGAALTLRVIDVAGRLVREIRTVPDASAAHGVVTWDGRDRDGRPSPSGIYYLRLSGGGLDDARAVILIR